MIETIMKLANGTGINVRYSEDNSKEAIVFLHFSGGNVTMWNGILPLFEDDYRVIAPDMRGHGKSDNPTTGYHIDDMANDVYLLLQQLDVKQCHIVGSSMGAEIGLSMAANYPDTVLSLVCEGALFNEFGEYGQFQGNEEEIEQYKDNVRTHLTNRKNGFQTEDEFINEQKEQLQKEGLWNEIFLNFFKNSVEQTREGTFIYRYRDHVRKEYIEKYWTLRFEEYYKKVQCPVLFLPSEEESRSDLIKNNLLVFSALLHDSEVRYIENSVHAYVWMQFPTNAAEVVKQFISRSHYA